MTKDQVPGLGVSSGCVIDAVTRALIRQLAERARATRLQHHIRRILVDAPGPESDATRRSSAHQG